MTGRRKQFPTIRTPGGLSGFAEPMESPHDTLAAGHAGTGLSYALAVGPKAASKNSNPQIGRTGPPPTDAEAGPGTAGAGFSGTKARPRHRAAARAIESAVNVASSRCW